jgi:small-conductance mechanosensitive channel
MASVLAATAPAAKDSIWERTLNHAILLAIVVVAAAIVLWVARRAIRRAGDRVERATGSDVAAARRNAAITFAVVNVVRVVVFTTLVFVLLAVLGVDIGPVLASAGIIGAGLAFGAQAIVRDYLAGFYILTENQFSVGDSIETTLTGAPHPVTGIVVDLSLRRTAVRLRDGSIVSYGNGSIVSCRNRSRGTGVLRVEVEVPRRGSLDTMYRELEDLVAEVQRDPAVAGLATSDLFALGAEPTASGGAQLIVTAETLPAQRTELEREIRVRMNRRFLSQPATVDGDPPPGEDDGRG